MLASRKIALGRVRWRLFEVTALVVVSGLYSHFVVKGTGIPELRWRAIVSFFSPIISLYIVGMAVVPEERSFGQVDDWKGWLGRGVLGVLSVPWIVKVFVGTPMVDELFSIPLRGSGAFPVFGNVFRHVVFQHWLQTLAGLAMALVPKQFATLTDSPTPAGVQYAVVECE